MNVGPNIFQYDNFRDFLRDFYVQSKSADKKFSFRYFARVAGFKSYSFLSLVMKGKSNISRKSAERLAKAMRLTSDETVFFKHLVEMNQAQTPTKREFHAREILRFRAYRKAHPLSAAQFRYYAEWYFVVVRGLVGLPNFKEDPAWIAQCIKPQITPTEAKRALDELLKLGLIERSENGKLRQSNPTVATTNEVTSSFVAQFHREMMNLASESIDHFAREKRDISSLTVGVSEKTASKLKEMMDQFRYSIAEVVAHDEGPDKIYQLNLQLFPVAELPTDGDRREK